ncbi:MAG: hypothetical protein L3K02_05810 [Thermoplasmata archaeon]|nr:hypothetical protein [Thermoplasmata archaeon]
MSAATAIVVVTYVLVVWKERYRLLLAAGGAAVMLGSGLVPISALWPTGWDGQGGLLQWNTLALLLGLFVFATLLSLLGFFRWAGFRLAQRTQGRAVLLFLGLTGLAFVLSAFLDSIVVVLVLSAITIETARRVGQDPIPLLIAEISAANLGGAATLVGDPPNLILGTYFHLSFFDFLLHTGLPAVAGLAVALLLFSRSVERTHAPPNLDHVAPAVLDRSPVAASLAVFGGLMVVLAVQAPLGVPVWAIGLAAAFAGFALAGPARIRALFRSVDFETLAFFTFLFILVGGLVTTGVIASLSGGFGTAGGGNLLVTGSLLLWTFGLLSAVVNSVPLAAAAAPLIARLGAGTGMSTSSLVYAVALGNDIGGNGTPIGASGNIVGLGVARRLGVTISWSQFVRRSFPIMIACLATANLVWLFLR